MYQDIQNFSELTAIDTKELLEVQVSLKMHGNVDFVFLLNEDKFTELEFKRRYPINSLLSFGIKLLNFEKETGAIEISSIKVNEKEILPLYLHLATPQTSYINFSEPWNFTIDRYFYPWYHGITGQGWIA